MRRHMARRNAFPEELATGASHARPAQNRMDCNVAPEPLRPMLTICATASGDSCSRRTIDITSRFELDCFVFFWACRPDLLQFFTRYA